MARNNKKKKDPNAQSDTSLKLWNVDYNDLRELEKGFGDNMSDSEKSDWTRAGKSFMDELRVLLNEEVSNAPAAGDGRKIPFLTKSSSKLIERMKKLLSEELYKALYGRYFYKMDTPEAVMCLMPHIFQQEIGLTDSDLNSVIERRGLDIERIILNADQELIKHKILNNKSEDNHANITVPDMYICHNGLYKSLPIVSDDAVEACSLLTMAGDKKVHDLQTSICKEPFTSMNGQIGKLITLVDNSYGRTFLEGTKFIPEGHSDDPTKFQSIVADHIDPKFSKLIKIETQERKTGPRKTADPNTFWNQIKEQYEDREMTKEAKESFNRHAAETSKHLQSKIGRKLDPWPIFAGITSSSQLLQLRGVIIGGNKKTSKEAYSLWIEILKASSQIETVYGKIAKNTSKGAPYYTKKVTYLEWLDLGIAFLQRIENPCFASITTPFVIGERLQNSTLTEDGYKVRHRAIMALSAIYLEQQAFNLPLMEEMKELEEFTSYKSHADVGVVLEKKLQHLIEEDSEFYCLSLDYSAYDTRVSAELLEPGLWNLLKDLYSPPSWIDLKCLNDRYFIHERDTKGKIVKSTLNEELYINDMFNYWQKFYTEVPLLVPGGIKFGKHGLFSGAPGTTHIGSLLNLIRSTGACKDLGGEIIVSMFQGDDTLLAYKAKEEIPLERWSKHMEGYCHLVADDAVKQAYMKSTDEQPYFMFVGKYYFIKGLDDKYLYKDIYCITDQISRCYYPEPGTSTAGDETLIKHYSHYDFNDYLYKTRNGKVQPSIAMAVKIIQSIANCKNHPLWEEFTVDYVLSKPGIFKPLSDFGDAGVYWDLLNGSGTLIGSSKEDFISGFKSDPTVQLVLETLATIDHEYIETIYTEDIIANKVKAEKATKDLRLKRIDTDEAKSLLSSLEHITTSKAYKELEDIINEESDDLY